MLRGHGAFFIALISSIPHISMVIFQQSVLYNIFKNNLTVFSANQQNENTPVMQK